MELDIQIEVYGRELKGIYSDEFVSFSAIKGQTLSGDDEVKSFLIDAIKEAISDQPMACAKSQGITITLTDEAAGCDYSIVARVKTGDESLERYFNDRYPEVINVLGDGTTISYSAPL